MIWLQHLPFATKLSLLQRFFVIAQGLEVSSVAARRGGMMAVQDETWLTNGAAVDAAVREG